MLYKFSTLDYFADDADRCGVIQANSLQEAVDRLIRWNKIDWGDYIPSEPEVVIAPEQDQAIVSYKVKSLTDPEDGVDSYIIRPVGDDIISFMAQDWNLTFD